MGRLNSTSMREGKLCIQNDEEATKKPLFSKNVCHFTDNKDKESVEVIIASYWNDMALKNIKKTGYLMYEGC